MAKLFVSQKWRAELQEYVANDRLPPAEMISSQEVLVLLAFLREPIDPDEYAIEEYSDVFAQGVLECGVIQSIIGDLVGRGILISAGENGATVVGEKAGKMTSAHNDLQFVECVKLSAGGK
jgi:hypothetical protein